MRNVEITLPPGLETEIGLPGTPGPPGPPAITDVFANELLYGQDVQLPAGMQKDVLSLPLPPGEYVVSAQMSLTNNGSSAQEVDVFLNAYPSPTRIAGPRAVNVVIPPGDCASVTLGPVSVEVGAPLTAFLFAQRDNSAPADRVTAVADTRVARRGGATGILAMGHRSSPDG